MGILAGPETAEAGVLEPGHSIVVVRVVWDHLVSVRFRVPRQPYCVEKKRLVPSSKKG